MNHTPPSNSIESPLTTNTPHITIQRDFGSLRFVCRDLKFPLSTRFVLCPWTSTRRNWFLDKRFANELGVFDSYRLAYRTPTWDVRSFRWARVKPHIAEEEARMLHACTPALRDLADANSMRCLLYVSPSRFEFYWHGPGVYQLATPRSVVVNVPSIPLSVVERATVSCVLALAIR